MQRCAKVIFGGLVGDRVEKNVKNYLSTIPFAGNAMFTAFKERDEGGRDKPIMLFACEFPGKLLTSVAECYRLGFGRNELKRAGDYLVSMLASVQSEDGYLGLHNREVCYVGTPENITWDLWGVYHNMYGLLLWYQETSSGKAYDVCLKSADHICNFFEVHDIEECCQGEGRVANGSAGRIFCLLYELTGAERYYCMAKKFEKNWETAEDGDYVNAALQGRSFHEMKLHRWESLHSLLQISDLYRITGEEKYYKAFKFLWEDILEHDVHNTGGYSSGEGSCGNPYDFRAIELCCSITWLQITTEYFKITKESRAVDELEKTFYNALLGSQNPTGRWWTYSAPMCGKKKPAVDTVVYQGFHFDGCHEINCCSANAGRALGLLSEWGILSDGKTIYINFYGSGKFETSLGITLYQETEYPIDGKIKITILDGGKATLKFRIPAWSGDTKAIVCGKDYEALAGTYMECTRQWSTGDTVELFFDMRLHCVWGDQRVENRASIYYGPILLTFDCGHNPEFPKSRLLINQEGNYQPMGWLSLFLENVKFNQEKLLEIKPVKSEDMYPQPWVKFCVTDRDNEKVYLIDYATAGMANELFTTWFDVERGHR